MKKKEKKNRITTLDAVIIIVVIFLISAAVPLAISRCAVPDIQPFKAEITLDGRSVEVNVSPEGRIAPVKCWPLTLKGGKSGVGSGRYIYVFDFAPADGDIEARVFDGSITEFRVAWDEDFKYELEPELFSAKRVSTQDGFLTNEVTLTVASNMPRETIYIRTPELRELKDGSDETIPSVELAVDVRTEKQKGT